MVRSPAPKLPTEDSGADKYILLPLKLNEPELENAQEATGGTTKNETEKLVPVPPALYGVTTYVAQAGRKRKRSGRAKTEEMEVSGKVNFEIIVFQHVFE